MATQYQPAIIQPVFPIIKNDAGELRHQTPEQLHPGYIIGDSNAANQARKAFTAVSSTLATLNTKYVKGSPDFERSLEVAYQQTISIALGVGSLTISPFSGISSLPTLAGAAS